MLPSRGCCHGVFLLAHAAKYRTKDSVDTWIQAARERSTFMSRALQFDEIVTGLLKLGLVTVRDRVVMADAFEGLSEQADRTTLLAIARILFDVSPPSWLRFAVRDGQVAREYIPTEALENLSWMEPELDRVLLDIHSDNAAHEDEEFLKAMGDVAELFIMAALVHAGKCPLHVSKLSDSYGYDIECGGEVPDRIEVKAASILSQSRFHISRNEFEKSSQYGREWRLVQVVFSGKAFVTDHLDSSHIETVRELRQGVLQDLVPRDTEAFKWIQSAQLSPTIEAWKPGAVSLDPEYSTDGFRKSRRSS